MAKVEPLVMRVKLKFIEECLGTVPGDEDLHRTYVAGKIKDEKRSKGVYETLTDEERDARFAEECEAAERLNIDDEMQKGKTYFPRDVHGNPVFWNYQIRGFFKSACAACKMIGGSVSSGVKAYKKKIDLGIMVYANYLDMENRQIIILDKNGHTPKMGDCQRSLRADTPQGSRTAIADSESIPAGSTIEFDIVSLAGEKDRELIEEWLDYGRYNGLGGWRNSGKGAFVWEDVIEEED